MEQNNKWGIVYCPKHGWRHRHNWEKVEAALKAKGVDYDYVQSESQGSVERLVSMMINNGYRTIIIVGGDSALNEAVNCLMRVEKSHRDEISLGVIPNGVMNDYARYWGFDEDQLENTVEQLAKHRVRRIDLGCMHYTDKNGEQQNRHFLNCVNVGLVAGLMDLRQQTRHFFGSRMLSFISSLVVMIFRRKEYRMDLTINHERIARRVMSVCIGSGPGYGQTPSAVPYNGMLDVSLVWQPEVLQLFNGVWLLLTNRFLNHKNVLPYRTREVKFEKAKYAPVGIDGHAIGTPIGAFSITVAQEVINFLIPE